MMLQHDDTVLTDIFVKCRNIADQQKLVCIFMSAHEACDQTDTQKRKYDDLKEEAKKKYQINERK